MLVEGLEFKPPVLGGPIMQMNREMKTSFTLEFAQRVDDIIREFIQILFLTIQNKSLLLV